MFLWIILLVKQSTSMKKLFVILSCILFINTLADAQYRIYKTKYDYRSYKHQVGDPYNPSVVGFVSFLIPGMGQMSSGEIGRGLIFLGGLTGCIVIFAYGVNNWYEEGGNVHGGPGPEYLGFFGAICIDLFSVVDAVRVAKVNDLAFREKNKAEINFHISPYFASFPNEKIPVGLSLRIRF
jgi:hypothetical protein